MAWLISTADGSLPVIVSKNIALKSAVSVPDN